MTGSSVDAHGEGRRVGALVVDQRAASRRPRARSASMRAEQHPVLVDEVAVGADLPREQRDALGDVDPDLVRQRDA